jgi:hypothetical protein
VKPAVGYGGWIHLPIPILLPVLSKIEAKNRPRAGLFEAVWQGIIISWGAASLLNNFANFCVCFYLANKNC